MCLKVGEVREIEFKLKGLTRERKMTLGLGIRRLKKLRVQEIWISTVHTCSLIMHASVMASIVWDISC